MPIALSVLGSSTFVLFVLFVLFKKEAANGARIVLPGVREHLDNAVLKLGSVIVNTFEYIGAGTFRATIHYILHQVLGVVIGGLTRAQKKLYELYERHTRIVRDKHRSENVTHLNEIAAHKEETALSDGEKQKLKSHQ